MAEERLQKILSRSGVASRRAAEELILAGRVELNGEVVRELGTRADSRKDVIRVDDRVIAEPEDLVYYVLYKPERVVTTLSDPEGRDSVGNLLRRVRARVYPVGRLDYDAEGVLLLTNDGDLAHKLTHPRWGVKRTYLAKVKGEPADAALDRMVEGVRLEDGMAKAIEATFEKRTPKNTWIRLVVAEGRHHLVKRLCEAVGHPVVRLFRSDYAGITVDGMQPGEVRELASRDVLMLRKAVENEAPPPPGGRRRRPMRGGAGAVRDPIYGTVRREGPGAGGFGRGERPAFGRGFGEGGRPGFNRGGRPGFGEGAGRGGRPGFGDGGRSGFGGGGRPGYGEGASRGGRPGFGEGAGRGEFGEGGRPGFSRGGRPGFGAGGAPGGRPGFGAGGRPGSAPGGRPGFGAGGRPGAAPGGRPGFGAGGRPGSAPGARPGFGAGGRPGAAPGARPGFGAGGRSGAAPGGRPGFGAGAGRGAFGDGGRPGSGGRGRPAFGESGRPGRGGFGSGGRSDEGARGGSGERPAPVRFQGAGGGFSAWAREEGFAEKGDSPRTSGAPRRSGGKPARGPARSGARRPPPRGGGNRRS